MTRSADDKQDFLTAALSPLVLASVSSGAKIFG